MNVQEIQKKIRWRMKRMKIEDRELALRMGLNRATLWSFFRPSSSITLRTLNRIARALECEVKISLKPLKGGK